MEIRPKLIIYQLRAFCFGEMSERRMKHDSKRIKTNVCKLF